MKVPIYKAAWRALWIVPAHSLRVLFVAVIFCGWGSDSAKRAWRETR